jgi:DNA mismatch repair protein MutL
MSDSEGGGAHVRELSGALIDQIAAGEVVERPASVVKELVENALDAGARRVRVEARGGGADWIAVTDDGSGMSPEDARMALRRHATSKIAAMADLEEIRTYGFRGEALPAIASVARLRLRSRPHSAAEAFELRVEAGVVQDERVTGAPVGTRIEVADLFSAVPARRKFLKSATTEWGHISDWLTRAAKWGVFPKHKVLNLPRDQVVSIVRLTEVQTG